MLKYILYLLVLLPCVVHAQGDDKPPQDAPSDAVFTTITEFKPAIRGFFKLPNAVANNAFKKVFNGVSNLEVSFVYPFAKYFFGGVALQHGYYDINRSAFPEVPNGKMQSFMGVGEIGFQKYMNPRWYYLISVRGGYGLVRIKNDNCDKTETVPHQSVPFNEALFGLYLKGNERMTYGLVISHQIHHFHFNPGWLCRTSFGGLTDADYVGPSHSITIGFGVSVFLGDVGE